MLESVQARDACVQSSKHLASHVLTVRSMGESALYGQEMKNRQ